jgi:hypothetical protein
VVSPAHSLGARYGWSVYGAKRTQPVATARKWSKAKNGSNSPIRNRRQPTGNGSGAHGKEGVDRAAPRRHVGTSSVTNRLSERAIPHASFVMHW